MDVTYTIGEIAERSGFPASALRYYEGLGLVMPATRTLGGYRVYDGRTLDRLAFIARLKRLGCSLDEVGDLLALRDEERCGPVQRRFHDLVTDKIADAQRQSGDLATLTEQLRAAAAMLEGRATDGPCEDGCACVASPAGGDGREGAVGLGEQRPTVVACGLDAGAVPDRLAQWSALLAHATRRATTASGARRVELTDDVDLGALGRLVRLEQACCAFFAFAVTVDHRGVALEVSAPTGAGPVVDALFGPADDG